MLLVLRILLTIMVVFSVGLAPSVVVCIFWPTIPDNILMIIIGASFFLGIIFGLKVLWEF